MTQRELAKRAGITINYLSLLENGKRGVGLDLLDTMADVLGVPVVILMSLASTPGAASDEDSNRLLAAIQSLARQAISLYGAAEDRP